jgi:2-polyprenyl-3-methyl-5-hydroxy-6-metoxy-1,4-benzoquinol methylase
VALSERENNRNLMCEIMKIHLQGLTFGEIFVKIRNRITGREARHLFAELQALRTKLSNIESGSAWKKTDTHLVEYLKLAPNPINALSIFKDEWSSTLPSQLGIAGPGPHQLFDDARIKQIYEYIPDISQFKILELGPLEGGHSFMLNSKAKKIVAIEANRNAFLKCLIVKNLLSLDKVEFLYGDFMQLNEKESYDLIVAVGVLYHMENPVQLLESLSRISDRIFFWTHYFEPDLSKWNSGLRESMDLKWNTSESEVISGGILSNIRVVRYKYNEALGWNGFCGGPGLSANWIYREDFLHALSSLGYKEIEITFDMPDHVNGPAFCVYASR